MCLLLFEYFRLKIKKSINKVEEKRTNQQKLLIIVTLNGDFQYYTVGELIYDISTLSF